MGREGERGVEVGTDGGLLSTGLAVSVLRISMSLPCLLGEQPTPNLNITRVLFQLYTRRPSSADRVEWAHEPARRQVLDVRAEHEVAHSALALPQVLGGLQEPQLGGRRLKPVVTNPRRGTDATPVQNAA
jgi:hypothetical protein